MAEPSPRMSAAAVPAVSGGSAAASALRPQPRTAAVHPANDAGQPRSSRVTPSAVFVVASSARTPLSRHAAAASASPGLAGPGIDDSRPTASTSSPACRSSAGPEIIRWTRPEISAQSSPRRNAVARRMVVVDSPASMERSGSGRAGVCSGSSSR